MTKVDELVQWCRTQNVIPACGTKERNDLADLVAQRSKIEIKQFFRQIADDQRAVQRWLWLVCTVCSADAASDLIKWTLVSWLYQQELVAHETELTSGWTEINTARREIASAQSDLEARELRMTATVADLAKAEQRISEMYSEIHDLRREVARLTQIEAEHAVFLQALRRGLNSTYIIPLEKRIADQYAQAVTVLADIQAGYPDDELHTPIDTVINDALALFTEWGETPADLAQMRLTWHLENNYA